MTLKQIPNSISAPDGSQYVTLTDGAGNLVTAGGGGTPAAPVNSIQFNNTGAFGGSANLTYDNTNHQILSSSGTVNNPSFAFTNSVSTGIYSPSATQITLVASGTDVIRVASNAITTNAGINVGGSTNLPQDTQIARAVSGVLEVNNGTIGALTGTYIHWGGQSRVISDFSVTSSTTLTNVTGLSVSVLAGRTYYFEAILHCTDATAGGVQAAIAGTATATNIIYDGVAYDANTLKGQTNATALGTAVASTTTTGTTPYIEIRGTITVNAAGTLTVQFAQNTSNATASIVKRGSTFIVNDIA